MPNCAIIDPKTGQVLHFVRDCVRNGDAFIGTNGVVVCKTEGLSVKWTTDEAAEVKEQKTIPAPDGQIAGTYDLITGYDKTAADLIEAPAPGPEIRRPDHFTWADAVAKRAELADLTFAQLDTYIDNQVADLASAKAYLKKLSKVVLAMIKMADHHG
jgi:hypothetical protein